MQFKTMYGISINGHFLAWETVPGVYTTDLYATEAAAKAEVEKFYEGLDAVVVPVKVAVS